MVQEIGGFCKGYVVDISRKEEVYKAAEVIRHEVGDVSIPPCIYIYGILTCHDDDFKCDFLGNSS